MMRCICFVILCLFPLLLLGRGQTKKIGDVIENPDGSKGVVFWVDPDGLGGWMVALKDQGLATWGQTNVSVPGLTGWDYWDPKAHGKVLTDTAGYGNTKKIRDFQGIGTSYAAQIVDFENGWYLPALGQLRKLFAAIRIINPILLANGGEKLETAGNGAYFSSSAVTDSRVAWGCLFSNGQILVISKGMKLGIRAIRSFSYSETRYDPALTYHWKSGETTPMIEDIPQHTKEYEVTVSSSVGCKSVASKQILVAKGQDTTIYAAICKGETYREHGFSVSVPGVYSKTLRGGNGCDVTLNLVLSVNEPIKTEFYDNICDGEIYRQHNFTVWNAGTYTQTWTARNGCDSLVFLHLTVNPIEEQFIYASICEGNVYTDHGFHESASGTYTRTLQNKFGCDSVVTLVLDVHAVYRPVIQASICEGEVYSANGFHESASGTYTRTLQSKFGCDSVVTLVLDVHPVYRPVIQASICEGEIYSANGFHESTSGTYTHTLQSKFGCDSVVTLVLDVVTFYQHTLQASICEGEVYSANGFHESVSGTYTQSLQSKFGCDSIVTLILDVHPVYHQTLQASICEGEVYSANGFHESIGGIYVRTFQSKFGCDSIVTLVLDVNPVYRQTIQASICEGEVYSGNDFQESVGGIYTHTFQSKFSCDSIITLILDVSPVYHHTIQASICEGEVYSINGFQESTSGTYTQTLQSKSGCDSIVSLILEVNPVYKQAMSASICQGETYAANGFQESVSGIYKNLLRSKSGCDSLITLTLTVNPVYLFESAQNICEGDRYDFFGVPLTLPGTYKHHLITREGCDSVYQVVLEVRQHRDTLIEAEICEGDTYRENGFNVSKAGMYVQHLQTYTQCDSTVRLQLSVKKSFEGAIVYLLKDCKTHSYSFGVEEKQVFPDDISWLWDFGDGSTGEDKEMEHIYEKEGTYRVTLKTNDACGRIADYLLNVPNYSNDLEISADRLEIDEKHAEICLWTESIPGMLYKWDLDDGTLLSGPEICHAYKIQKEFYDVKLTVTNSDDCQMDKKVRIMASRNIVPPNTFSPNGDGINDFFMRGYRLRIVDRNGVEVFKGHDGWDGTSKGKQVPEDTYFFEIFIQGMESATVKTGYITLVR